MIKEKNNNETALLNEKFEIVKELTQYLHSAKFDRKTLTSTMLKELREKINNMILNDF
jgi:hypothetical protein